MKTHYEWLEEHLPTFFKNIEIDWQPVCGIIVAHGDKGYQYKRKWENAGIHFYHAMAIYLASYCKPYNNEVRETKDRFLKFLPTIKE